MKVARQKNSPFPSFLFLSVMACALQVPDIDSLLSHIFADLDEHPNKAEGAGQLLFEMCKGVRNMFHSCADKVSCLIGMTS